MNNNNMKTSKMRDLLKGMSLSDRKVLLSEMDEEKSKVTVLEERRKTFQDLLNQWGYKCPTEFLVECEFEPNPSVKKPRTKITEETREKIVTDLRAKLSTKEIATKYGVTGDSVYNIKGKAGLTKRRGDSIPSPTVTAPISTVSVIPSNVTPMVQSEPLKEVA